MVSARDKLQGRLAAQILHFVGSHRENDIFATKSTMFCNKTAPNFDFVVMHADIL